MKSSDIQVSSATPFAATAAQQQTTKLKDGAREFEAMMLGEMLKPLQFGGAPGDGEEAGGGANETIRSFGTEAVAKAIASHGGFGIADKIIRQVGAERDARNANVAGTKV